MLKALSFLSPTDIPEYFRDLKAVATKDGLKIFNFFENNYVLGKKNRKERSPVPYPPTFWSVGSLVDDNLPRTQNTVEAWHRRLNSVISRSHIGCYKLINELKQEHIYIKNLIENIKKGNIKKRLAKYKKRDERIKTVLSEKDMRSKLNFLQGLAYNLTLC